jgi:hypothetical protein
MASRHNWTPEQVNSMDPDFIEELNRFYKAKARKDDEDAKRAERRAKRKR